MDRASRTEFVSREDLPEAEIDRGDDLYPDFGVRINPLKYAVDFFFSIGTEWQSPMEVYMEARAIGLSEEQALSDKAEQAERFRTKFFMKQPWDE